MNPAQQWWLTNTPAGRRVLDRIVPPSALPPVTRQLICEEQGHDELGDGTCRRCGEVVPCRCVYPSKCFCRPNQKEARRR